MNPPEKRQLPIIQRLNPQGEPVDAGCPVPFQSSLRHRARIRLQSNLGILLNGEMSADSGKQ